MVGGAAMAQVPMEPRRASAPALGGAAAARQRCWQRRVERRSTAALRRPAHGCALVLAALLSRGGSLVAAADSASGGLGELLAFTMGLDGDLARGSAGPVHASVLWPEVGGCPDVDTLFAEGRARSQQALGGLQRRLAEVAARSGAAEGAGSWPADTRGAAPKPIGLLDVLAPLSHGAVSIVDALLTASSVVLTNHRDSGCDLGPLRAPLAPLAVAWEPLRVELHALQGRVLAAALEGRLQTARGDDSAYRAIVGEAERLAALLQRAVALLSPETDAGGPQAAMAAAPPPRPDAGVLTADGDACARFGGILHKDGAKCCASACGARCGSSDCEEGPGGPTACCGRAIPSARRCGDGGVGAPCTLRGSGSTGFEDLDLYSSDGPSREALARVLSNMVAPSGSALSA
eukprot:TRINITY_DN72083_c0_g1_i1.p1 TRINITY_DN72083_c0_g1~~TRINITY_DN72083_c0_g1_i1.p1  ORF type:complete len:420 (+),score=79.18 TRINITY_DN72083_c0_g1_i1:47-1261(+)